MPNRCLLLITMSVTVVCAHCEAAAAQSQTRRQPVAIALLNDHQLAVANAVSGTVQWLDDRDWTVQAEQTIGTRLADLAASADREWLLAVDPAENRVVFLKQDGAEWRIQQRVDVPAAPVAAVWGIEDRTVYVATRWSRRLAVLHRNETGDWKRVQSLPLSFAPGRLYMVPGQPRLVIAGAFGGWLAVWDTQHQKLLGQRELPLHNIGGLEWDRRRQRLLVSHQTIEPRAPTTFDDVHWGQLMQNGVASVSLSVLEGRETLAERPLDMIRLGHAGNGAGDPAGLLVGNDQTLLIALAGTHEVAMGFTDGLIVGRVPVGRRPTVIVRREGEDWACVVNTFSDSLSILDTRRNRVIREVRLSDSGGSDLDAVARGEQLFYDARLSLDGWYSCHSCHTDGHANTRLSDTVGDGGYGNPKRVPSLLGLAGTQPFAWNGSLSSLHDQIRQSASSTMQGQPLDESQVDDLAAFLQSLPPAPPIVKTPLSAELAERVRQGERVFHRRGCAECHRPDGRFTTKAVFDVGLKDERGLDQFNPPSLRGVAQRQPLFHDGRAKSLEDALDKVRHQLDSDLSAAERRALLAFLRSL